MKLLPHFYQVACPQLSHSYDASAYLLDTGSGLVMLDCATPDGFEAMCANIRRLGFAPEEVKTIYGTHGHYDHVGAAARFAALSGCRLALHPADIPAVQKGDDEATTAGPLYSRHFTATPVQLALHGGEEYLWPNLTLRVLHTPGHTPGGLCFVVETAGLSVLVAGDTLWGGFHRMIGSDEGAWRQSLDMLCALPLTHLTFGHTGPSLYADAPARLAEARRQFATYYNPWFKPMGESFRY